MIVSTFIYADDIVILAESEDDLQSLIDIVNQWCSKWRLSVNLLKTNIMHVRNRRKAISNYNFILGGNQIKYCSKYKYLGVTIFEHLIFEQTANELHDPASRALCSVVSKLIKNKGLPLKVYKILWESCVISVAQYGSEVWGFKKNKCTERLFNRAVRTYLGLGPAAPMGGAKAELMWLQPVSYSHIKIINYFFRLQQFPNNIIF